MVTKLVFDLTEATLQLSDGEYEIIVIGEGGATRQRLTVTKDQAADAFKLCDQRLMATQPPAPSEARQPHSTEALPQAAQADPETPRQGR